MQSIKTFMLSLTVLSLIIFLILIITPLILGLFLLSTLFSVSAILLFKFQNIRTEKSQLWH